MPLPKFTEEDIKAAEREVGVRGKGKEKKHTVTTALEEANTPAEKSARVGAVRSLHHIDDEDFEDTKERAERAKEAMAREAEANAEKAKSRNTKISLEGAVKKDDSVKPEGKKRAKKSTDEEAPATPAEETETVSEDNGNDN